MQLWREAGGRGDKGVHEWVDTAPFPSFGVSCESVNPLAVSGLMRFRGRALCGIRSPAGLGDAAFSSGTRGETEMEQLQFPVRENAGWTRERLPGREAGAAWSCLHGLFTPRGTAGSMVSRAQNYLGLEESWSLKQRGLVSPGTAVGGAGWYGWEVTKREQSRM